MIEEWLYSRLSALNLGDVSPNTADQATGFPYIVYQQTSDIQFDALSDKGSLGRVDFQVDVFAKTSLETNQMAKAIKDELHYLQDLAATPVIDRVMHENTTSLYDEKLLTHRKSIDFSIFYCI